jgi:peptidoglycan LD-endopeptidase CwlK
MASRYKLSKNSKKNLEGVRPELITLVERVLKKSPHDFGIPKLGGKRTAEEQNSLFHKVPKLTNLDGYKKISYHQSGNAVDIFIYDEHGACWDCRDKYREVADLMKSEFILMQEEDCLFQDEFFRWGGDWKSFKDLPHFEVRRK